jgi:hypothetical protein
MVVERQRWYRKRSVVPCGTKPRTGVIAFPAGADHWPAKQGAKTTPTSTGWCGPWRDDSLAAGFRLRAGRVLRHTWSPVANVRQTMARSARELPPGRCIATPGGGMAAADHGSAPSVGAPHGQSDTVPNGGAGGDRDGAGTNPVPVGNRNAPPPCFRISDALSPPRPTDLSSVARGSRGIELRIQAQTQDTGDRLAPVRQASEKIQGRLAVIDHENEPTLGQLAPELE